MIAYEDVLASEGLTEFCNERRQRYFHTGLGFCRSHLGPRFKAVDDTLGLAHVSLAYDVGTSFGLRSERDHLKLLIAVAHWGLGFATDPRLADRLIACGWLRKDRSRHRSVRVSTLLRAVDDWHRDVRPQDGWVDAVRATADVRTKVASGREALQIAHDIWPNETRDMSPQARAEFAAWLDDKPPGGDAEGRILVLHALLGLRLGYWYLSEPTFKALRQALPGEEDTPSGFDNFLVAATALPTRNGK